MRVCFLAHNLKDDNGGGTLARHIVLGLRESLNCGAAVFTYELSGLPFENALSRGKFGFFRNFFALRNEFKKCDVIHAFDIFPYGILAAFASLGLRKKFVLTAVGTGSVLPLYQKFYSFLVKWTFRRADRIIAISRFTRDEILKKVRGLNIEIINPGLDAKDYRLAAEVKISGIIKKYQPYILSVGAIRKRKGYHLSVRAFAEVSKKFPELKYLIVGKSSKGSPYREDLSRLIKDLNLENKVFLIENAGDKETLYSYYRGAELFCLFSQNTGHDVEGFGIVFLEAAVCALPVVGTKGCGIDDAALDGKNGLLVSESDTAGFADSMIRILSDKNLKMRMAEESLTFSKKCEWTGRIEEYKKIYSDLV